ncbi:transposable element Tcb2 transposase [Trichonephila clavipes]|nr:transposable element Tcb2 transposase [Trichonephila clavipes]
MTQIVPHNDESISEGYIRNGGKEVKLFTSTLKAFQCNNLIVMAQRKHLDDFLRGRIIGRLECRRTQLTDLHVQSVTMTGHTYRDVILEQHVRLFRGAMGAEFLFRDDNARPHRANIVDECLQSEYITLMDWPELTALKSNRTCVGYAWLTNCSPSTPSHVSTGTSEGIA